MPPVPEVEAPPPPSSSKNAPAKCLSSHKNIGYVTFKPGDSLSSSSSSSSSSSYVPSSSSSSSSSSYVSSSSSSSLNRRALDDPSLVLDRRALDRDRGRSNPSTPRAPLSTPPFARAPASATSSSTVRARDSPAFSALTPRALPPPPPPPPVSSRECACDVFMRVTTACACACAASPGRCAL